MQYTRDMPVIAPADWAARGTVLSSTDQTPFDFTKLPDGTSAKKFVYQSISGITGATTVVGGAVFVPGGAPPPGGWPVIGNAHFTTGVVPDCGTLEDSQLSGLISSVDDLLGQGYAVAYTDYAGLGEAATADGANQVHAYLEPKSEAFNLIDAVTAARSLVPELSNRWVAYGGSQGGQAAWATAEYFPTYSAATELLGAVALAPALDITGIGALAEDSALDKDQKTIWPVLIAGLAAVDPDIDPDDFMTGALRQGLGAVVACRGPNAEHQHAAVNHVTDDDFTISSPEAAARLVSRLESYSLPQRPTPIPILAMYGGIDPLINPAWTEDAIGRACALGDKIVKVRLDDQGHGVDPGAIDDRWIAARFAGQPAESNC